MKCIVHSAAGIEDLLRRGLTPITDNKEALLGLGFERAYPRIRSGYESTIWERSIDRPKHESRRFMARERAFLEPAEERPAARQPA